MHETEAQPLRGLRLAVISFDLQQREHRGIAVFSKALLKALKQAGAEVWLLADLDPPLNDNGLMMAPESVRQEIYQARVLDSLANGYAGPLSRGCEQIRLSFKSRKLRKLAEAARVIPRLADLLRLRRNVNLAELPGINLNQTTDNPYLRLERLNFLEELDGILCARYFYLNHYRSGTTKHPRPIQLQADGFNAVISTAPINAKARGCGTMVQVIHDLIPLEYVPASGEHVGLFTQRMHSAGNCLRLFVSDSTRNKYNRLFSKPECLASRVVLQPPSLEFARKSLVSQEPPKPLKPYRYLLFNSSVEPRKNLLFLIRAYRDTGLAEMGIALCVTGQLKKDSYSQAVAAQKDDSVILMGYVDEATKANLFLNALLVLSPSVVEGFGIPVLDAACVGAAVIASQSESHLEIQAQHDFANQVWICDTRKPQDWTLAIRHATEAEMNRIRDTGKERQRRLERYEAMNTKITRAFGLDVCDAIRSETAGSAAHG